MDRELKKIQKEIRDYKEKYPDRSVGRLKDTYHSFDELYRHRALLTALAFINIPFAWKAKVHEDGTMFDGMFIVGCPTPSGMITYHYENEYWDLFKVPALPHAPKFDGHTPDDVCNRIEEYIKSADVHMHLVNNENIKTIEKIVQDQILPVFGDDIVAKGAFVGFYNRDNRIISI